MSAILVLLMSACRGSAPTEPAPVQPDAHVQSTSSTTQGEREPEPEGDDAVTGEPDSADSAPVVRLAAPPWRAEVRRAIAVAQGPVPQLRVLSARRNEIIDDERWFQENELAFGAPFDLPANLRADKTIFQGDHAIVLRGEGGNFHTLIAVDRNGRTFAWFDFSAYVLTPDIVPEGTGTFDQSLAWAEIRDGVLYVSSYHMSYARTSGGLNAYITAIELETAELLWRSPPLVSNSANFLIRDGWIITGYGFTKEDDHVIVLDQRTGEVEKRVSVKTGPTYILEAKGRLFVRTYDTNYEFSL